ncbi:MAG: hypothetical protein ACUVRZ_06525 [Desulfobacca sp.]|uniref:hypothetical protein n=1 Tax=Desulfobacca sp. TaxID=2067990 RepID=UPI00404AC3DF
MHWSRWIGGLVLAICLMAASCSLQKEAVPADKRKGKARRQLSRCENGITFTVAFSPGGESVPVLLPEKRL